MAQVLESMDSDLVWIVVQVGVVFAIHIALDAEYWWVVPAIEGETRLGRCHTTPCCVLCKLF